MKRKYSEDQLKKIIADKASGDSVDLAIELSRVYSVNQSEQFIRAQKLLEHSLEDASSYHDHKENMAHGAFLLQVALFGSLMTISDWPLAWIPELNLSSRSVAFIGYFLIWFLIHLFIRWQLRNKRWAAMRYAGFYRTFLKWTSEPPTEKGLGHFKFSGVASKPSRLKNFFDFIFVFPSAKIVSDVDSDGYPSDVAANMKEQEKQRTGAILAESFLTYGSILILFIVCLRTFFGTK